MPIFASYITEHDEFDLSNLIVVAPDVGSVKRSRTLADVLNVPLAIIDKRREKENVSEVMNVIGNVDGKDVIMFDDIIDTAGTIANAATALRGLGAKKIYAACTHALLSGPAMARITESPIEKLYITDTIPVAKEKLTHKIEIVSIAPLVAKAIHRIHFGSSVSVLFDKH
jgi:ribose-phosphate pyrophosphokinase